MTASSNRLLESRQRLTTEIEKATAALNARSDVLVTGDPEALSRFDEEQKRIQIIDSLVQSLKKVKAEESVINALIAERTAALLRQASAQATFDDIQAYDASSLAALLKARKLLDEINGLEGKRADVVRDSETAIKDLNKEAFALATLTPDAFAEFDKFRQRNGQIMALKETLVEAGIETSKITELTRQYGEALDNLDTAKETFERTGRLIGGIQDTIRQAANESGNALASIFIRGGDAAEVFGNIVNNVLERIISNILNAQLLDPLGDFAASVFASFLGGGSNFGGSKALAGGVPPAQPLGLFGFARGGRPQTNRPALVGEEGPEIFVPDRAGTIISNRNAFGGGGGGGGGGGAINLSLNVRIINNTDSEVQTKQSRGANGQPQLDVLIDRSIGRSIRGGGESYRAISQTFGLSPQIAGR